MKFYRIKTIFLKELTEIFRDKRAVAVTILVPIFLFPICFKILTSSFWNRKEVSVLVPLSVQDCKEEISFVLNASGTFHFVKDEIPEDALRKGRIAAILHCFYAKDLPPQIIVTIDNSNQKSIHSASKIMEEIEKFSDTTAPSLNLKSYKIELKTVNDPLVGAGSLLLSLLLPTLIFLFSAVAPMVIAGDIFAGEKERYTLEHLLSLPLTRIDLILGKYSAVVVMGIIGVFAYAVGLMISYVLLSDVIRLSGIAFNISIHSVLKISSIVVVLVMVFSAAEFAISIVSKSVKESQLLSIPLIIVSVAFGQSSYSLDIWNINPIYRFLPLANMSILLKETIVGFPETKWILLAFCESFLLIVLMFVICRIFLSNEKYSVKY